MPILLKPHAEESDTSTLLMGDILSLLLQSPNAESILCNFIAVLLIIVSLFSGSVESENPKMCLVKINLWYSSCLVKLRGNALLLRQHKLRP